jgi:hypothetical protein
MVNGEWVISPLESVSGRIGGVKKIFRFFFWGG